MSDKQHPAAPLTGSFGSTSWQIRVPPEIVPVLAAKFDWNRLGRRVVIDPLEGLICWMKPSSPHAGYAAAADKVAERAGRLRGLRVKDLRDTRWRQRPGDPANTGMEADACFYIGAAAEGWLAAHRRGADAELEFVDRTPPDLVVEIEWTGYDRGKACRWAELGVGEMWRAERRGDGVEVAILDPQAAAGPAQVEESVNFPGLSVPGLEKLLVLAYQTQLREMETLLEDLMSPPGPGPEPDDSSHGPGF